MWSLIQLLPQLIKLGRELLHRVEVEQARKFLKKQHREMQELDEDLDKDSLHGTRKFFNAGVQSDKPGSTGD